MSFAETVKQSVGQSITQICPNRFHDHRQNHCAHYVSHMTGMSHYLNCKDYLGGNKVGGNIRVQEIFPECPKVGHFRDAPLDRPFLVFITAARYVNIPLKKIRNVRKKHTGIFLDGKVFHYSNSRDKVVAQDPNVFKRMMERSYGEPLGMYFGTIPGSDLLLRIDPSGENLDASVSFRLGKKENKWYAKRTDLENAKPFYVGRELKDSSKKYFGIFRKTSEFDGHQFKGDDYVDEYDHWSYLLEVTGFCESKNHFNTFNTYDRAKFTYGFYQLAAHTPSDNLILFFRKIARLKRFKNYFPELTLVNNQLHRINQDGGSTNLEKVYVTSNNKKRLKNFMDYLNPQRKDIDEQEVLHLARLIDWTNRDPKIRQAQVEMSFEILQYKMQRYNKWYNLDGKSDIICALIADIHHQGRAKRRDVLKAVNSDSPIKNLAFIRPGYTNRVNNLKRIMTKLRDAGKLGEKRYHAGLNEFS